MTFNILVVCTGNICRSPAGQLLLQSYLDDSIEATSAGTHAVVGHPVEPQMAHLLPPGLGDGFEARQLRTSMIREADLVLPMTRRHKSFVLEEFPAAMRRTFTVTEFAAALQSIPAAQGGTSCADYLSASIPQLTRPRLEPGAADVADPYRRDDAAFEVAFREIDQAARLIASRCGISPAV